MFKLIYVSRKAIQIQIQIHTLTNRHNEHTHTHTPCTRLLNERFNK